MCTMKIFILDVRFRQNIKFILLLTKFVFIYFVLANNFVRKSENAHFLWHFKGRNCIQYDLVILVIAMYR